MRIKDAALSGAGTFSIPIDAASLVAATRATINVDSSGRLILPSNLISDATTAGKNLITAADIAAQRTALSVYSKAETDSLIAVVNNKADTNTSDISTINSNISTINSNISTNTSNISTNTSNIATNTSNIATHTTNISTLNGNITTLTNNFSTLNASNLTSGTVPVARLGSSGTAGSTTFLNGSNAWATAVTSVTFTVPGVLFSVTGSPVTTSSTLALSLLTQNANVIFAGPNTGSAATPTFRSLVKADQVTATAYSDVNNLFTTAQTITNDATGNVNLSLKNILNQTGNALEAKTSTNVLYAYITGKTSLTTNGDTGFSISVATALGGAAQTYAAQFINTAGSGSAGTISGITSTVTTTASHTLGVANQAVTNTSAGTLTDGQCYRAQMSATGTGTVTSWTGLSVQNGFKSGSGSIGTIYGIKIEDITTASTNNYAWYSGKGSHRFGDSTASSKMGWFGVTPASQQTGGAATATGTWTATEQGMLQKVYDCFRTFGLLT